MELTSKTKAWLLKGDPKRPDPGGLMKEARQKLVEHLERTTLEALCGECQETLRTLGFVALHVEHDQKTHGNREGGPGGSTATGGRHAVSFEEFQTTKDHWGSLNTKLISYLGHPNHPEAKKIVQEQKEIVKQINQMEVNPGNLPAIGIPGETRDLVIIGAGPGGLSAATGGGTEGLTTMVIDAQTETGGAAKTSSRIENFPNYPIGVRGRDLFHDMQRNAERVGADLKLGVKVTDIKYDAETGLKTLTLSNGETVEARSVVLATGTRQVVPDFPGADRMILGDAEKVASEGKGKHVVILGGANSAAQAALGAADTSKSVTLVSRSPLEKGMSEYVRNTLENHPKIRIEIADIDKYEGNILKLKNGKEIAADKAAVFYGGKPNTEFLPPEIRRYKGGLIDVNIDLETSMPGVFAVGDVRRGTGSRIITAAGDGQVATKNIFNYFDTIRPQLEIQAQRGRKKSGFKAAANRDKTANRDNKSKHDREWDRLVDEMAEVDELFPFRGELAEDAETEPRTLGFVALHGEHDQKTHGNREGGGAAEKALSAVPEAIRKESQATFRVSETKEEAAKDIDEYLLKNYGFDTKGQAWSLVDRDRNMVFTTPDQVRSQFARTLTSRIESPEWCEAIATLNRDPALRSTPLKTEPFFVDAFTELFNSEAVLETAKLGDPISRLLETDVVQNVFKKWGWQ